MNTAASFSGKFQPYDKLIPFISPLAPFLDPGSSVFEEPEKYGYRLLYRTVEEHRQALLSPSWKYILNYETEWMDRDAIVYSTYEAGKRLNRLKAEFGLISRKTAESIERRIEKAVQMMKEIDRIMALPDPKERERALDARPQRFLCPPPLQHVHGLRKERTGVAHPVLSDELFQDSQDTPDEEEAQCLRPPAKRYSVRYPV